MDKEVMYTSTYTILKTDHDSVDKNEGERNNMLSSEPVKNKLKWGYIIIIIILHLGAIYGLYLVFSSSAQIYTIIFAYGLAVSSILGITAGAHRLWSHRSYKAKWPLRFILMIMNCIAFQLSIYHWAIDHRIHHKYSETNSDPHSSSRGFFFAHIGWLLVERHPDHSKKRREFNIEDLRNDRIVMFQKKYYIRLVLLLCFYIPTVIPVYLWGETYVNAFFIASILRYICVLHLTFSINSVAHMWGNRPYDASIGPTNNLYLALNTFGEGYHNYHHVFPWDYQTDEHDNFSFHLITIFINFFARIGWAYDMKTVSKDMILKRASRTGDGTNINLINNTWGWDDSNICSEDQQLTIILNRKDD